MSLGHLFPILAIYTLAVARVVTFINHDKLLDALFLAIEKRVRDTDRSNVERDRWAMLSDFLTCPRCVSIWVAGFSVWIPLWHADNIVARYAAIVLAVSYLVSVAAPLTALKPREYEPTKAA